MYSEARGTCHVHVTNNRPLPCSCHVHAANNQPLPCSCHKQPTLATYDSTWPFEWTFAVHETRHLPCTTHFVVDRTDICLARDQTLPHTTKLCHTQPNFATHNHPLPYTQPDLGIYMAELGHICRGSRVMMRGYRISAHGMCPRVGPCPDTGNVWSRGLSAISRGTILIKKVVQLFGTTF
jgi:hypothetical protein